MSRNSAVRRTAGVLSGKTVPKGHARLAEPPAPFDPRLGPAFLHDLDSIRSPVGRVVGTGRRTPVAPWVELPDQMPTNSPEALALVRERWNIELKHLEDANRSTTPRAALLRKFLIITNPTRTREIVAADLRGLRLQLEAEWHKQQAMCSLKSMTRRILEAIVAQAGQNLKPGATVIKSPRWIERFRAAGDDPERMMHMAVCDGYLTRAAADGTHRLTAEGVSAIKCHHITQK